VGDAPQSRAIAPLAAEHSIVVASDILAAKRG
jgi:hypothetical protein